ncbi:MULTISPECIES: TadE/TadG family type IV pilus assembly protein [Bradyrhizobium]|uniref:TadE/TadG family type IV pilus assembly protein n=1 Tax=Bradyrhizobium TaxID=374 RepID=UPI00048736EA|nr:MULTISPECIES: pilus assembly protein TadG-related protein [Bradyrhizobium]MBR0881408.1 pilus assembly protein [Bradyrhizobium liaoningense]MBR0943271.1 pilus assembly protein [Bradyrhizobium liaoningense]MBR0995925.1 pilus assembly protein [Bradyrhizobium liaoningense]MBR1025676.1 pilus assembly protein [Bradyrhizobium liaoningense]MBR1062976.1 pilus assembly protein [Bradyrhizobium liaoningense]
MLRRVVLRFARDRKANIAVIFALTMVPIIFLLGMTLDYTQAVRKRGQLDAAADAAAIAAVRPAMLTQSDKTVVQATAAAVFAAKANLPGLTATPTPTITVTDSGLARTITVSYTAKSVNNFPSVLGKQTWDVAGSATAKASSAPNMNFFLLMDDSPSMGIGATTTDISNLIKYTAPAYQTATASQNCGFACHQTNIAHDGGTKDNLAIARQRNIALRIDLVTSAVNQLLNTWSNCPQSGISGGVMQCMSALNNTTYKAALYTFDLSLNELAKLATPSLAGGQVSNISLMPVAYQNCVVVTTNCKTDNGTNIAGALKSINDIMPTPGLGSNAQGDTPQEVVFLVTDGVEDKISATCPNATFASNSRCQQPLDTAMCTTIKNRGIKIAVLYTEYLQLIANAATGIQKTDQWYMSWIDKYNQPTSSTGQIAQNLQACASPGFYSHVQTGGDISAALTDLFIKVASSTASLVQ